MALNLKDFRHYLITINFAGEHLFAKKLLINNNWLELVWSEKNEKYYRTVDVRKLVESV